MEDPNQTMAQCSSNSSTIYEVLGVLHHYLDDSAAESELSEAMMRMTGLELVESATIMRIQSQRGFELEGLIADFQEFSENDLWDQTSEKLEAFATVDSYKSITFEVLAKCDVLLNF